MKIEMQQQQTWDTESLTRDFDVIGFLAPFVEVIRKANSLV